MALAYAASQGGEHGSEANIGDIILHHVLDAKVLSIKKFTTVHFFSTK